MGNENTSIAWSLKKFWKSETSGWKISEILWFVGCLLAIALLSHSQDTILGVISATAGVACVLCTGKGKLTAYIFGAINALLYSYISYQAKLYGEFILNAFYFLPLQFYGFYVWSKHINPKTHEVEKYRLNDRERMALILGVALSTIVFGYILQKLGGNMPYIDALSTIISIVAMIISIQMYMEQWILWIIVDLATVAMWAIICLNGGNNMATLMMWTIYSINGFIMYARWNREIKSKNIDVSKNS